MKCLVYICRLRQELNMDMFEEHFKTRAQGNPADLSAKKKKVAQKVPSKTSLMDSNKAKNLAITLRKGRMNPSNICTAIERYCRCCVLLANAVCTTPRADVLYGSLLFCTGTTRSLCH